MVTKLIWLSKKLFKSVSAVFGLLVLVTVVVAAFGAPWLAPYDPYEQHIGSRLLPLMAESDVGLHILGTDALGRDMLSRIIYGSQTSLAVGVTSVVLGGGLGTLLGMLAGYYGGLFDTIVMRAVDVWLSIPFIVLALALVAVLGNGLLNVILALSLVGWVGYARTVRAEVLGLREREFVEGARAAGAQNFRILLRHIFPNLINSLTVLLTLEVGRRILSEASLSYLGLGVPPPIPTWGRMVAEGQEYLYSAWWVSAIPGVAILLTVLGLNLLGDWIRDVMDPRVLE